MASCMRGVCSCTQDSEGREASPTSICARSTVVLTSLASDLVTQLPADEPRPPVLTWQRCIHSAGNPFSSVKLAPSGRTTRLKHSSVTSLSGHSHCIVFTMTGVSVHLDHRVALPAQPDPYAHGAGGARHAPQPHPPTRPARRASPPGQPLLHYPTQSGVLLSIGVHTQTSVWHTSTCKRLAYTRLPASSMQLLRT